MRDVLIVEDDLAVAEVITEALEDDGIPVRHADDGRGALLAIAQAAPSVLLLDINLPRVDGRTVYLALQLQGLRDQMCVVVMTAGQGARRVCEELGADDYLSKPFDLAELTTIINRYTWDIT